MAARPPGVVCLLCRTRQRVIASRHQTPTSSRRRLQTLAQQPYNDERFPFGINETLLGSRPHNGQNIFGQSSSSSGSEETEELQKLQLDLYGLWKTSKARQATLRRLSNPSPPWPTGKPRKAVVAARHEYALRSAGPMSHAVFRERIRAAVLVNNAKAVRQLLRSQLLYCETTRDVLRVMAVAMQHRFASLQMAALAEPITRAAYRCRIQCTDLDILQMLSVILWRFRIADLPLAPALMYLGLKFSARARSLAGMKRYLKLLRETGVVLSSHGFRSIIAKFSIGHRGLGEIRNGRWKRDELWQVLKGFEDCTQLPRDQQFHLETFLDRDDWQFMHGWVAALSRCKHSISVWEEWEHWKRSDARKRPRVLESMTVGLTSRVRGDFWFVEQMAFTRDYNLAWKLLLETGIPFHRVRGRVQDKLLDGVECAGQWNEDMSAAMLRKYDSELSKIETALGVRWTPGVTDGEGTHVQVEDQEEALDRLGADDWQPPQEYGYPTEIDEAPIVSTMDMALQQAEERGLADAPST